MSVSKIINEIMPTLKKIPAAAEKNMINTAQPAQIKGILTEDTYKFSTKIQRLVNYNESFIGKLNFCEKLVSPKFNGCHGIMIHTEKGTSFAHFPQFMSEKIAQSLDNASTALKGSKDVKVVFIAPTSSGLIDSGFNEYEKIIKNAFGDNINFEYLTYPSRRSGGTHTFEATVGKNGTLESTLNLIKRTNYAS